MARSIALVVAVLLGAACLVSAAGPRLKGKMDMDSCKVAAKCYYDTTCRDYDEDKESSSGDRGSSFRDCYFDCLKDDLPSDSDGDEFVDLLKDVYEWCEDKRSSKASAGKIQKCMLHKIKKDYGCEDYFGGGSDRK